MDTTPQPDAQTDTDTDTDRGVIDLPIPPPGTMGPPQEYDRLRRECPLAKVRLPIDATAWYATRYNDVKHLIADPRFIRPSITDWPPRPGHTPHDEPGLITMMELEGPRHTALRKALCEPFSIRSIRNRLPRIRRTADQLLTPFTHSDQPADLVVRFLEPFPVSVMCDLVGIPYHDSEYFLPQADAALGAILTLQEGREATSHLREYITALLDRKRREPGDDILTTLVRECEHGTLDHDSAITFGLSMLVAGYRTSTMFLADTAHTLLTHPHHYAHLRDHPDLIPTAVEELLRYIPVMNGVVVLQATEDIELHGRTVQAGDALLPVLAAANRDETVFTDPDRLDLHRAHNPHLTFGRGTHNCIGAHLARAQLTVCLQALFDHLPHMRLAEGHTPIWEDDSPSKSPLTLPITW
ncbi:cytochrome P450 [Streptomyces shenzhenensis]|uniref:cytochrome P450 n=1 Tax=Streptomyces shenzhenensis TaxID=943815 RepID=UPI00367CEE1D